MWSKRSISEKCQKTDISYFPPERILSTIDSAPSDFLKIKYGIFYADRDILFRSSIADVRLKFS